MATTSKEVLLEKKVFMLERRLALVERFVELRFCETFRDFTIRNSDRKNPGTGDTKGGPDTTRRYQDDDDNDTFFGEDFQEESSPPTSSKRPARSTRPKNPVTKKHGGPSSSSSTKNGDTPLIKDCVIRIVRNESGNSKKLATTTAAKQDGEGGKDQSSSRYGTRRQTRLAKQVKVEVDEENVQAGEDEGEMEQEDDGGNDNGGEDDYFSFPPEQNETLEGLGDDRENIEELDEQYEPNDTFEDVASGSDYEEESEKSPKRKRKSTANLATSAGKKKFYHSEMNRKRKRIRRPYKTSLKDLSQETKIVSSDTTREECPICKRHYKKELIQQHVNSHMRERTLQCPHCDKRYYGANELRTHVKITHDREKYFRKCRLCGDAIVRKLILHEKYCVKKALKEGRHVDENLLEDVKKQCAENGLEFTLDDLETSFPPGVDPAEKLECPHCNKYFQRRLFDRHVKMHSMKRNWKCSKCPKAYIHKHDLIRHMLATHEASLECEICSKTFMTRMDLGNHTKKCKKTAIKESNLSSIDSGEQEVATRQTSEIADDENEDDVDVEEDIATKQCEDGNSNLATEPTEEEAIIV